MEIRQTAKKRIVLFDEIRGFCVLFMIFFHGAYDIVYVFGHDMPWFRGFVMQGILQPLDAGLFVLLAGYSSRYSRSNLKRGLITLGLGLGITLVTWRFMPDQLILFGILHGQGTFMLLFAAGEKILQVLQKHSKGKGSRKRIEPLLGFGIFMLLFALVYKINNGAIGFFRIPFFSLPNALYTTKWGFLLGFPGPSFGSADYFAILPWFLLFMAGSYVGRWTQEKKTPPFFGQSHCKPVAWIGRHSLIIYVLHQPILYAILLVFFTATQKSL